eukprot:7168568-Pyramimonas_sp.AAC.2
MSVQMVEVYNDQLRDLLAANTSSSFFGQKKDEFRFVDGVVNTTSKQVYCTNDVVKVMAEGDKNRAIGSTKLNVASSRSHQVVTVMVEGKDLTTGTRASSFCVVPIFNQERDWSIGHFGRLKKGPARCNNRQTGGSDN